MSFAVFLFWAGVVRDFMPRGNPHMLIVCHSIVGGRWWAFLLWSLTLICLFYAVSFAMVFCQFVCHGRSFDGFSELQPNIINCLQDSSFKIFLVMLLCLPVTGDLLLSFVFWLGGGVSLHEIEVARLACML